MVNRNVSHLRHSCNTDTGTSRRCPARHWPRYSWRGSLVCFPIRPSRHPHTYCPLPRPLHRRPADRHGFPRLATSQWFWCLPGQWWHRRVLRRLVLWLKTEKYQRYKKEGRNYFNSRWLSILLWRKNRIFILVKLILLFLRIMIINQSVGELRRRIALFYETRPTRNQVLGT